MTQPYAPIDYSQYQKNASGKYGAYGSTPPPGMLNPHTMVGGFNGYTFGEQEGVGPGATGTANMTKGSFSKSAGYLLKGSQDAAQSAVRGFESMYRARAQGEAAGFGEQQDRLGGEVAAQGYSPDLVKRMLLGGQGASQARIGQARGEADQGFQMFMAELQRNTGLELSQLSDEERNFIQQAYIAKQARKAGQQAAQIGFAGSALGAVGTAFGGGFGKGG